MALAPEWRLTLKRNGGSRTPDRWLKLTQIIQIGIFPSDSSVMRLIGAYLMEIDEDWTTGRVYMDMKKYDLWVKEQEDKKKAQKMETVSDKTVEAA